MEGLPEGTPSAEESAAVESLGERRDAELRASLDDDLNISAALAAVHAFVREANKTVRFRETGRLALARLAAWDSVLGVLGDASAPEGEAGPRGEKQSIGLSRLTVTQVEDLMAKREEARRRRDYAESDRIRKFLRDQKIVVKDTPHGAKWYPEAE
jgi:cysteinyl-tRNA synthetase